MVWRVLKFSVQFPTHITPYRLPQLSSVDFTLKSSGIQKHRFKWAVKSFNQNSLLKYLYEIKFLFIHNNSKVTLQYFFSNFVGFQRVEMCAGASACLHCVVLVSDAKHITAFAQLTWKCIPPFFCIRLLHFVLPLFAKLREKFVANKKKKKAFYLWCICHCFHLLHLTRKTGRNSSHVSFDNAYRDINGRTRMNLTLAQDQYKCPNNVSQTYFF